MLLRLFISPSATHCFLQSLSLSMVPPLLLLPKPLCLTPMNPSAILLTLVFEINPAPSDHFTPLPLLPALSQLPSSPAWKLAAPPVGLLLPSSPGQRDVLRYQSVHVAFLREGLSPCPPNRIPWHVVAHASCPPWASCSGCWCRCTPSTSRPLPERPIPELLSAHTSFKVILPRRGLS